MRYREALIRQQTRLNGQQEANGWQGDAQVQRWLAADVATVAAKLAEVDAAIDELLAQLPEAAVVRAIKGVGPVVTAAVLGALPIAWWGDAKNASAYFGLVPKLTQSGKRSQSRMSKAGPGDVRGGSCGWRPARPSTTIRPSAPGMTPCWPVARPNNWPNVP